MLVLKGWKSWELNLLKGSIVVFVFPAMWAAGAVLIGLGVGYVIAPIGEAVLPELVLAIVLAVLQGVGGLAVALYACRWTWPTTEESRATREAAPMDPRQKIALAVLLVASAALAFFLFATG